MALKFRLETKVAIVTGAGSRAAGIGNGRAAAILFAREGAAVVVADLNGDGRPEIIAPGKEGLYVFFNEGSE